MMIDRLFRLIFCALVLLPSSFYAQQVYLKDWTIEDHSGNAEIQVSVDTLEITSPAGLTLWYNPRLTGNYEISYFAKMLMLGGKNDRLSDLNCFWAANDPEHPDDLFARKAWRNGIFKHYKTLNLFYVGYGGNHNSTTRFRKYFAKGADVADDTARPVIKEYTDASHLLFPNKWYHIKIRVRKGVTTYSINGKELFRSAVGKGECDGHFGLRLLENHVLFAGFRIKRF